MAATEWDAFPVANPQKSSMSEWDAFPVAKAKAPNMGAFGLIEAAANVASGMGASAAGGLAGLGSLVTGGSLEDADRNLSSIQTKYTYQPRSVEGKVISHVAGLPFEYATKGGEWLGKTVGKPFGLEDEGALVGNVGTASAMTLLGGRSALKNAHKIGPIAQTAFEAAKREVKSVGKPKSPVTYAPSKLAELQAASIENAPMLDAVKAAQRIGGKLDPAVSNPTTFNKAMTMAAGEGLLDNVLSAKNAASWAKAGAKELGIKYLSIEELKAGRVRRGAPYEEIKTIPNIASGAEVQSAIAGVMARDGMTPAVADLVFKDVSPLVSNITSAAKGGVNGADIINLTRKLRKDANTIYKQDFPTPEAIAKADASKAISRALEDLTAKRLEVMDAKMPGKGYGDLASRWADARQYIANSHAWENATNAATNKLDPRKFAAITAKDNALTGVAADVGKIANNMPGIAKHVTEPRLIAERAARYGVPGLTGWGLGSMVGAPGAGAMLGMAAGAIAPPLLRKLISSSKYQAKHAFPRDFRPPPPLPVPPIPPLNPSVVSRPLPEIPDSIVIPQSWRDGINGKMERHPLPVIPDHLLPLSEQYPQGIPIGAAEGRMPQPRTRLPKLYPDNPLLQMADDQPRGKLSDLGKSVPFDTRLDVLNSPLMVKATRAFIDEAAGLKAAIAKETNGVNKSTLEAKLRGTENRFMAGLKEMGIRNEAEARNLIRKLYETGGETQREIVKSKSLKDLSNGEK